VLQYAQFSVKYGFIRIPNDPSRLFLPMGTVAKMFSPCLEIADGIFREHRAWGRKGESKHQMGGADQFSNVRAYGDGQTRCALATPAALRKSSSKVAKGKPSRIANCR